jgi:hypothetical protein
LYDCRLPDGPDDPEHHAKRLDAWLARHQERGEPRSVSEGLQRATLIERVAELTRQARLLVHETDAAKIRAFQERKAAVLTAIAEARPWRRRRGGRCHGRSRGPREPACSRNS